MVNGFFGTDVAQPVRFLLIESLNSATKM